MSHSQPPKGSPGADRLDKGAVRTRGPKSSLEQPLLLALPGYQPPRGPVVEIDDQEPEQAAAIVAFALSGHLPANQIGAASAALIANTSVETVRRVLRGIAPLETAVEVAAALGLTVAVSAPCGCDGRSAVTP